MCTCERCGHDEKPSDAGCAEGFFTRRYFGGRDQPGRRTSRLASFSARGRTISTQKKAVGMDTR